MAQEPEVSMPDDLSAFVEHVTDVARSGLVTGRAIAPERYTEIAWAAKTATE